MQEIQTFTIGLTMAGAVSAGAYTAGALDLLFRALDAHNAAVGTPDGPRHRVQVKVMSGASAGGACTGLAAAALIGCGRNGRLPGPTRARDVGADAHDYVLGPVYDVWVDGLDLFHRSDEGFLALTDLKGRRAHPRVRSLLNSWHIVEVAGAALGAIRRPPEAQPLDFIASDLDLFLTTTNLMGVPYSVAFAGADADAAHAMAQHSVVRHYRLSGLGLGGKPSPWLEQWRDAGIQLPLPEPGKPINFRDAGWADLNVTSIATGAFPLGLSPQLLHATVGHYGIGPDPGLLPGGAWPIEDDPREKPFPPAFQSRFGVEHRDFPVPYVAVDGGVINNEPFEYARFTIRETFAQRENREEQENARTGSADVAVVHDNGSGSGLWLAANRREKIKADRAVIMIDPFPEGPEFTVPDLLDEKGELLSMLANLRLLPGALKDQARFKPSLLLLARDTDVASRFLIAPSRGPEDGLPAAKGAAALASGMLYGFGGFLDRSFRVHDFMLGQHNCASFLAKHFVLDPGNDLLGLTNEEKAMWANRVLTGEVKGVPVVRVDLLAPDGACGVSDSLFKQPSWPRVRLGRLARLHDAAEERLYAVVDRLKGELELGWLTSLALTLAWCWNRPAALGRLVGLALASLIERRQMEGVDDRDDRALNPVAREILVEIARNGRTPLSLVKLRNRINDRRTADARSRAGDDPARLDEAETRQHLARLADLDLLWMASADGPYALALNPPRLHVAFCERLKAHGRSRHFSRPRAARGNGAA